MASACDRLFGEVGAFAKSTGKVCEKCGKPMVHWVKKPGKDGKGGYDFWGCIGLAGVQRNPMTEIPLLAGKPEGFLKTTHLHIE